MGAAQDGSEAPLGEAQVDSGFLERMDQFFEEWIPQPALQVLAIIVVFLVIAKLSDWLLCGMVRNWAKRTRFAFDDQLVELLHSPLFRTVLVLGVEFAALRLDLDEEVHAQTQRILNTIILLIWTIFAFRLVQAFLHTALNREDRFRSIEHRTYPLFDNLGKVLVAGLSIYLFIEIWGISTTGWFASAGIVGIALGFAAKDSLANLITGVFIVTDAPYRVGDFIVLEDGTRGQVQHIGLRSTRIVSRDDIEITIPNNVLGNTRITNETGGSHSKRRIRIKLGVAYGSDIDKVRQVLLAVAAAEEQACKEPEPRVRFRSFGESALDFELLCWIPEPILRGRVTDALNCAIYKRFAAEEIEIAFPQRDLYIKEMPSAKRTADAS